MHTHTHTDVSYILSYPGIRNVSYFFAFLSLEKIIDSRNCVISTQVEKNKTKHNNNTKNPTKPQTNTQTKKQKQQQKNPKDI